MNKVSKTCYIAMSNLFLHDSCHFTNQSWLKRFVSYGRKSILKGFAANHGTQRLF